MKICCDYFGAYILPSDWRIVPIFLLPNNARIWITIATIGHEAVLSDIHKDCEQLASFHIEMTHRKDV